MVVEMKEGFKKIQVKTVYSKTPSDKFRVELRTRTHAKGKVYSQKGLGNVDFVFIVTEIGEQYLIPRNKITQKTTLTLNTIFEKYKL